MTSVGVMASAVSPPPAAVLPLSIPWHSAFWASDPGWTPPASGGAVSSWHNAGTCAVDAVQATGANQPIYQATYAGLNSKPALVWGGTVRWLRATSSPSIPQPNTIVVVGWSDPTGPATATINDAFAGTTRHILRNRVVGSVEMYAGSTVLTASAARMSMPFILMAQYNGASSTIRMNGTAYTVATTVGVQSFGDIIIGSDAGGGANTLKGALAFWAVCDRDLTAQEVTDLEAWAVAQYGVVIP